MSNSGAKRLTDNSDRGLIIQVKLFERTLSLLFCHRFLWQPKQIPQLIYQNQAVFPFKRGVIMIIQPMSLHLCKEQGNLLTYIKIVYTSYGNTHLNCFLGERHTISTLSAWRIWLPLRYMRRWWSVVVQKYAFLESSSSFEVGMKEFFLICLKSPPPGLSNRACQIPACGFLVRKNPQNLTQA
jgi:hypothetical protein